VTRGVLVTGASRRLGRAIAVRLAEEGTTVVVHWRSDEEGARETARLAEARGARAVTLGADLADAAASERLVLEAEEACGGLDVLVNNAAIFVRTPLATATVADFDRHMSVNARAPFVLSLVAGRRMKARGRGAIVNLACTSAEHPWAGWVPYSASKAAIANLTRGFARALAPEVRVNAVAPGPVLPAEGADPEHDRRAVDRTLLGRWGSPSDVAAAVAMLADAPYVTGVVLAVDGGRSIA
jgi:pteridine reductase